MMAATFALFCGGSAYAQSAEIYGGHQRAGVDLMWFKYFSNAEGKNSPFLFFSRNRASVDYENKTGAFGSVNAISWNLKNGLGAVAVGSFLNSGFTPKVGIQYFKARGDFMFFGWLVTDLKKHGQTDLFGLFRYQPRIRGELKMFAQAELFPVFRPYDSYWNITERFRLGLRKKAWACGLMADLNHSGKTKLTHTNNLGGFVRHEF